MKHTLFLLKCLPPSFREADFPSSRYSWLLQSSSVLLTTAGQRVFKTVIVVFSRSLLSNLRNNCKTENNNDNSENNNTKRKGNTVPLELMGNLGRLTACSHKASATVQESHLYRSKQRLRCKALPCHKIHV